MALAALTDGHLFWLTSRAAGIVAMLLASASVGFGLWQGLERRGASARDLRLVHEALSIGTMSAIAVHAATLLGDSFLRPGVLDLLVPFVSGYRQPWMSLGILAGWSMVGLGLAYYARGRIGVSRWRALHRFTALAWVAALAHALTMGTDAGEVWFLVLVLGAAAPPLALLGARWLGTPRPEAVAR